MSAKVTAQDMLSKFGPLIKAKAAELTKFASDFQATDGVEKALIIHNHFLETNETAEAITKDAQVSPAVLPFILHVVNPAYFTW
jgi:hypothetical protein